MVKLWRDTAAANRRTRERVYRHMADGQVAIVAVSQWLADRVVASGIWPGRLEMIPNGVNTEVFLPEPKAQARHELGLPAEGKVILCSAAGGIGNPFKNVGLLIEAVRKLPPSLDLTLVLLGGGDAQLDELGTHVVQPGYISSQEKLRQYYCAADLFVYLSRADTFGLVVAEAMACGTPVLATNVGGLPDIVVDGRTGWLIEPSAPAQEVARRLTQLLDQGQALADMGSRASAWIARCFSLELMGDRYLNLYRGMTGQAG